LSVTAPALVLTWISFAGIARSSRSSADVTFRVIIVSFTMVFAPWYTLCPAGLSLLASLPHRLGGGNIRHTRVGNLCVRNDRISRYEYKRRRDGGDFQYLWQFHRKRLLLRIANWKSSRNPPEHFRPIRGDADRAQRFGGESRVLKRFSVRNYIIAPLYINPVADEGPGP
jgi:hypothetical protein